MYFSDINYIHSVVQPPPKLFCNGHPCCSQYQNSIPFSQLHTIPSPVYVTFSLSLHPSMDTWVASIFWLLWTMLLWMLVYKYLFACLLWVLLGIYPGGQFLNHMVILCAFFFWRTDILFSTAATPFYTPTSKAQGFKFLHILTSMFSVCVCF